MIIRRIVNADGKNAVEVVVEFADERLTVGSVQFEWDLFQTLGGVVAARLVRAGCAPVSGAGRTAFQAITDLDPATRGRIG